MKKVWKIVRMIEVGRVFEGDFGPFVPETDWVNYKVSIVGQAVRYSLAYDGERFANGSDFARAERAIGDDFEAVLECIEKDFQDAAL